MQKSSKQPFIAIYIIIFLYAYCYDQVYYWYSAIPNEADLFGVSVAIGAIGLGFISDKFCRKKTLLFSLFIATPLIILAYFIHSIWLLIIAGLAFNPLPIVRAALTDNLRQYSKIRLMAIAFFLQFLPDGMYQIYIKFSPISSFYSVIIGLAIMIISAFIWFQDVRDEAIKLEQSDTTSYFHLFESKKVRLGLYTFLAFIPTQFVFVMAGKAIEIAKHSPDIYSLASGSFAVGALVALLYKRTPHTSILTIAYGFSFMLAVIPVLNEFIYSINLGSQAIHMISYGAQMGFYIPFVYDVVLSSSKTTHRATACGLLDFVYGLVYIIGMSYFSFLRENMLINILLIPIFFIIAIILQKRSETAMQKK